MIIYLDESYKTNKLSIWGLLFNPQNTPLLRKIVKIKDVEKFKTIKGEYRELKYSECNDDHRYRISIKMIDEFFKSNSYFRAIVVDHKYLDLDAFGKTDEYKAFKKAKAYKKFSELLLKHNLDNISGAVLYRDKTTLCKQDKFVEKMYDCFSPPKSIKIKHIEDVDSRDYRYQSLQLLDILIGSILNNHFPTYITEFKNNIRNYLINKMNVSSLLKDFWGSLDKKTKLTTYFKYNIWFWRPNKKD